MNFKFKYTDKIVGLFIIISIFLLFISLILIIYNQKLFTKKYYFSTQFKTAEGLKVNQDVIFKGFKIGKIKNFSLDKNNLVDTEFYIYEKFLEKITANSLISKATNPLTGSTIYFMQNNKSNQIAKEHSFIPSLDSDEGQLILSMGAIEKKTDSISNIINNVDIFLASLNKDYNASDNSIARILVNAADIVESIRNELSTINSIMKNLRTLSYNMKDPDGLAQRMLDPDGTMMFNSIKSSLDSLSIMMEELSVFSTFLNSQSKTIESLLIEGKETMIDAQEVIEGIKNNPLIRGGIEKKKDQEIIKETIRDRDF